MPDWLARITRTAIQLGAAGVLTAFLTQVSKDVPPFYTPYVLIGSTLLVTFCQNIAEQEGWIKPILKPADAHEQRAGE